MISSAAFHSLHGSISQGLARPHGIITSRNIIAADHGVTKNYPLHDDILIFDNMLIFYPCRKNARLAEDEVDASDIAAIRCAAVHFSFTKAGEP